MIKALQKKLSIIQKRLKPRLFQCFQIEVTSRCNQRCTVCPKQYQEKKGEGDLSWENFLQIAQYLPLTNWVHLQGWGEPLLHEKFTAMLKVAKGHLCVTSFTTNGSLLFPEISKELIELDVHRLGLSLAGTSSAVHESIRIGSNLEQILSHLDGLNRLKRDARKKEPRVVISFLLTKKNYAELSLLPSLARDYGVEEIVIHNLDYINHLSIHQQKAFSREDSRKIQEKLDTIKVKAEKLGLLWRNPSLILTDTPSCELYPTQMLFLSSQACLSPCAYLSSMGLPTLKRYFCGQGVEVEPLVFGDLRREALLEIWEKENYKQFRTLFQKRVAAAQEILEESWEEMRMKEYSSRFKRAMDDNPLPEPCQTCYKAYGI